MKATPKDSFYIAKENGNEVRSECTKQASSKSKVAQGNNLFPEQLVAKLKMRGSKGVWVTWSLNG